MCVYVYVKSRGEEEEEEEEKDLILAVGEESGNNVLYIQTNFGSVAVGLSAIPSALPKAVCN